MKCAAMCSQARGGAGRDCSVRASELLGLIREECRQGGDAQMVVPAGDRCIVDTPQPLRIGGGAPSQYDQLPLTGMLDEVRIYDRALTAPEIAGL